MNKQDIINNSTQQLDPEENLVRFGCVRRSNLHLDIGPFTLSLAMGEGNYCSPRLGGITPESYDLVEAAILDGDGLMNVMDIRSTFGLSVAKLCESFGNEGQEDYSTVMPYITWDQVVTVANTIDRHSPSAKDLI